MPILDVELVTDGDALPEGLARRIADAAGVVLDARPGRVWVKVRTLDARHYAENDTHAALQPVFVSVLLAQHPPADAWARTAADLTRAVSEACARPPENVHILLLPDATGRMSFGGEFV